MLMRSRSMSNAKAGAPIQSKYQQQPQKSKSTHDFNCDSDNSNEFEETEDKTDGEFILKAKRITKRATKVKMEKSYLPELSPIFFKGLRVFVKLNKTPQTKTDDFNNEMMVKLALERNGSIIVDNPQFSDLIITDESNIKSSEIQSYNQSRQVLLDQISWIKDFMPLQTNDFNLQPNTISVSNINFSPKPSFKPSNRSALSSPMVNTDTSPHILQTPQKTKRITPGVRISSPIRHVILPSNATSPSATTHMSTTVSTTANTNPNILCTLNPSINKIMNTKNNSTNNNNQINISYQNRIQKISTRNLNDSYRKIQCLPIASHYPKAPEIVVSDYRHMYAPIIKVFSTTEQIPQLYVETAPPFYFMTPFQPVRPNANQIARSCMLDRGAKLQNKVSAAQSNLKANTNDVSAVIGKSNYYCYICRTNFEDPYEHHNSPYHMRNTKPLWEEFDSIAASFNEIAAQCKKES